MPATLVTLSCCLALATLVLVASPQAWWVSLASAQTGDEGDHSLDLNEPIVEVRIEGNITIPADAIAKSIKTIPGRPATPQQIREDVKSLYATRWFFSVEPRYRRTEQGLVLIFKVFERPVVERVEFRGNAKIKTKFLEALTGLKVGSAFDVSGNKESARRIEAHYREKGFPFATVQLEKGGSPDDREVVFDIHEGPKTKVTSVKFLGNNAFSGPLLKTKLRTKTALVGLIGGKYDPATIPDDIAALKQYYHNLGYFDVKIAHDVNFSQDKSRARIEYRIDEGMRYKLRNVELAPNEVYTEEDLRKDFKLKSGEYFNARKLHQDVEGIKDKYGELGRLFAKVEAMPRFLEEPGVVDLVYEIDEDRPYRFRRVDVHIQGDNPHTKETVVHNRLPFGSGQLASSKLLKLGETRLRGQLFENGPANAPRISVTPVPESAVQQANATQTRGQTPEDDARHRRVGFQPARADQRADSSGDSGNLHGQAGSLPYVEADGTRSVPATVRGQSFEGRIPPPSSPLFSNSPQGDPFGDSLRDPPPDLIEPRPGEVDVDVFVQEARTGRLMFGVGVNSDAGVVGSITLDEANFDLFRPPRSFQDFVDGTAFRGGGQRFRIEAVPGNIVSRYLVSWTDPYFLDTDYSLGVSGFYYNRFFPDWDEERTGGRVTLGRQLTPQLSVNGAIRVENVEIDNPDVPTPPILRRAVGSNFLSTFRAAVAHDTRDSAFLPSEGHFAEASYEQGFGDFVYPRFGGEARQYFTTFSRPDGGGRHILTLGGEVGWTGDDTPIFERFYAGGFQTFRGFAFRGVSPRQFGVRTGGQWLLLGSAEYKIPVTADDNIATVVFSDFGTVEDDVGIDDFRASVGVGLRLTIPAMGPAPLAFDFAVPLAKERFDDTQVFSFYIGLTR